MSQSQSRTRVFKYCCRSVPGTDLSEKSHPHPSGHSFLTGTKFGYYATIHKQKSAKFNLDQSIQSCKQVERDPDATEESEGNGFRPVINATTSCQEDDPEMILYRMPIFAFVTFNLEVQQQFVVENYDQKDSGIWKTLVKKYCGCKTNYALQLYRDHVQAVGKTSPYLAHPLPADTPEDIREMTKNLGARATSLLLKFVFVLFFVLD